MSLELKNLNSQLQAQQRDYSANVVAIRTQLEREEAKNHQL